ncbi:MAG TPA: phosphatase PAP2 family protein [Usitatibacter sp.]|nr:phosphatase PAP2 family protein [Usitatibacter sp.]
MIRHHDGIAGYWHGAQKTPALPSMKHDSFYEMWKWEPWVRAELIDFEMISSVRFLADDDAETATLTGPGNQLLASIKRPTAQVFKAQLDVINNYADLREDRASEIITQMGMQTPFWGMLAFLRPERTPKTIEYLAAAQRFATTVEMRFKHALACPRAIEYSPQLQPMILTPGHGSLPSGHSTQAYTIVEAYWALLPENRRPPLLRAQLEAQAARVAVNRTVAGVHFPVDTAAGHVLGTALGQYFAATCDPDAVTNTARPREFFGNLFRDDYDPAEFDAQSHPGHLGAPKPITAARSNVLNWLWQTARNEWREQGPPDPVDPPPPPGGGQVKAKRERVTTKHDRKQ